MIDKISLINYFSRLWVTRSIYFMLRRIIYSLRYSNLTIYSGVRLVNARFEDIAIIYENTSVYNSSIGTMTYIADNSFVRNADIGRYCSISYDVRIGLGLHPLDKFLSTHPSFYSSALHMMPSIGHDSSIEQTKRIVIGNDVLISASVRILDGISIGDGAVIGACSFVNRNVLPYEVVGGVPIRHIRFRFDKEKRDSLAELKWWDLHIDQVKILAKEYQL